MENILDEAINDTGITESLEEVGSGTESLLESTSNLDGLFESRLEDRQTGTELLQGAFTVLGVTIHGPRK